MTTPPKDLDPESAFARSVNQCTENLRNAMITELFRAEAQVAAWRIVLEKLDALFDQAVAEHNRRFPKKSAADTSPKPA